MSFKTIFDNFIQRYISASNSVNKGLLIEYDSEMVSPCYQEKNVKNGDWVSWLPVIRNLPNSMKNLSQALEVNVHDDIDILFGRYFSLDLNAQTQRGGLTILQSLNEQDFERFQKNLIAHVLMKRRLKQPDTFFFALTDEEDVLLSVLPESGEVVLEVVGQIHHETIASDLSSFFQILQPNPQLVEL